VSAEGPGREAAAFVREVERALAGPLPGPQAATPGAQILLLVEGAALAEVALALPALLGALAGASPRRPLVVVASETEACPGRATCERGFGAALERASLVVHDPDAPHLFRPGVTAGGVPIELDDVVLEAETLVTVGPLWREAGVVRGGAGLVFPGLASHRARRLLAEVGAGEDPAAGERRRRREVEEARAHVAVDLQLAWVTDAGGAFRAWAGAGRLAERAARRALGAEP
jgi:hypothetical protein